MPDPLPVTVVIPAYNAAAYLAATLQSVLCQTKVPHEVIVVDDGSTDDTAAIAGSLGARVISIRNGGVANARNVGIRAASTAWIAFLDADDIWRPERLEAQWRALAAAPGPLVVTTDYAYLVERRIVLDAVLQSFPHYRGMARRTVAPGVTRVDARDHCRAIVDGYFVITSTLLVDRRIFSEFDEYFPVRESLPDGGAEYFVGEDYEWYLRVLRHTDVLFVEMPWSITVGRRRAYRQAAVVSSTVTSFWEISSLRRRNAMSPAPQKLWPGAAFPTLRSGHAVFTRRRRRARSFHVRSGDARRPSSRYGFLRRDVRVRDGILGPAAICGDFSSLAEPHTSAVTTACVLGGPMEERANLPARGGREIGIAKHENVAPRRAGNVHEIDQFCKTRSRSSSSRRLPHLPGRTVLSQRTLRSHRARAFPLRASCTPGRPSRTEMKYEMTPSAL
jgi:glycosyltransferase involved in cell wall biosynthesis